MYPTPKTTRPSRSWIALLGAALVAVAAFAAGAAPAQAAPRMLTAAQLASDAPKTIIFDTTTGKITASWLGIAPDTTTQISVRGTCNTSDSCYVAKIPYADAGFYGTAGTKAGTWPQRTRVDSVGRTVKACYTGGCTPNLSPYTQVFLNPPVTGTSFRIL